MRLDENTQDLVRLALESHKHCAHEEPELCYTLTLLEVELRLGDPLTDEDIESCRVFMADCVLESLILKGFIEPVGIDPDSGDFYVGLTEAGEDIYLRSEEERG